MLDNINVYTVNLTKIVQYECENNYVEMVTLDREQAMAFAQSLVDSLTFDYFETTQVYVTGSQLGDAQAPVMLFLHSTDWQAHWNRIFRPSPEQEEEIMDRLLYTVEQACASTGRTQRGLSNLLLNGIRE